MSLQSVHGSRGTQFALVELERVHEKRRRSSVAMNMHPVRYRRSGTFVAAGKRDMRMESAHVQLKSGGKQSVVESLAKLKKSRVAGADSKPENSRRPIWRKRPHPFEGKHERRDVDVREALDHGINCIGRHVAQKAEGNVQVFCIRPCDTWQRLRESRKGFAHRRWQSEGNEQSFGVHGFYDGRAPVLRLDTTRDGPWRAMD
jgi:hypothetical protein